MYCIYSAGNASEVGASFLFRILVLQKKSAHIVTAMMYCFKKDEVKICSNIIF
jgi:hypothetical protein